MAPLIAFTTKIPVRCRRFAGTRGVAESSRCRRACRRAAIDDKAIGRRIVGAEKGIEHDIAAGADIIGDGQRSARTYPMGKDRAGIDVAERPTNPAMSSAAPELRNTAGGPERAG